MKKVLLAMMFVVLTLCLFVACSDSPDTKKGGYVCKVTIEGDVRDSDYNGTYYLKGGDDYNTLYSYKLYSDEECTEVVKYLGGDEPTDYSFLPEINENNLRVVAFGLVASKDGIDTEYVTVLDPSGNEGSASFKAGYEVSAVGEGATIKLEFVQDAVLKYYILLD